MIGIDFLKKVELFKGLNDDQLAAVQKCCETEEFQRGVRLFGEGEAASYLWVVKEGQVDIRFDLPREPTSEANNISSVTETMAFGWSGLVPPNKYTLSAYCGSRVCEVIKIGRSELLKLFEADADMGYNVMTNVNAVVARRFHQLQGVASDSPTAKVKITVHLATCGIAAGAREVMTAVMEEMSKAGRSDIQVESAGCIGKCPTEPNVTVKVGWEEPVIYQKMTADKVRQVFKNHVIGGEVQTDFVMPQ